MSTSSKTILENEVTIDLSEYESEIETIFKNHLSNVKSITELGIRIIKERKCSAEIAYNSIMAVVEKLKSKLQIEDSKQLPFEVVKKTWFYHQIPDELKQPQQTQIRKQISEQQQESEILESVNNQQSQQAQDAYTSPQQVEYQISEQTKEEFDRIDKEIEDNIVNIIVNVKGDILHNLITEIKKLDRMYLNSVILRLNTKVDKNKNKVSIESYELTY